MAKFKYGDKVKVLSKKEDWSGDSKSHIGEVGYVDIQRKQVFGNYESLERKCGDYWGIYNEYELELVEESLTNNNQTFMSKITTFIKNATLTADEKLLRKSGLHNDCGENTSEAKEAILEKFYNTTENQAYLLEIAKGLEAEEKK